MLYYYFDYFDNGTPNASIDSTDVIFILIALFFIVGGIVNIFNPYEKNNPDENYEVGDGEEIMNDGLVRKIMGICLILSGCIWFSVVTEPYYLCTYGKIIANDTYIEYERYINGDYLELTGTFDLLEEGLTGRYNSPVIKFSFKVDDVYFCGCYTKTDYLNKNEDSPPLLGYVENNLDRFEKLKTYEGKKVCVKFSERYGKQIVYSIEEVLEDNAL